MKLTESQWSVLEPFIPKFRRREDGKGRPRIDDRKNLKIPNNETRQTVNRLRQERKIKAEEER